MPSVIIEPAVPLSTQIGEIKAERKISGFSSKLYFFDYFILPCEKFESHKYFQPTRIRPLVVGEQAEFLNKNNLVFPVSVRGHAPIGEFCLKTKQDFEEGNFKPFRKADLKSLEKVSGSDIFISERLASTYQNEKPILTVEFVDGLPIPPRNWSYDGILEFKNKHYSEYRNFWDSIYNLASEGEFIEKPDLDMSIRKDILEGLREYNLYAAETFGTRLRSSFSISMTPARTAAFLALMFAPDGQPLVNLDLPIAYYFTVAGIGGVRLALDMKKSSPNLSQTAKGMSYLSKIHKVK